LNRGIALYPRNSSPWWSTVTRALRWLLSAGELGIRPLGLPGNLGTEPVRRVKRRCEGFAGEFHLDGTQPGEPALIDVDLGHQVTKNESVAHFGQSATLRRGPQLLGRLDRYCRFHLGSKHTPTGLDRKHRSPVGDADTHLDVTLDGQVALTKVFAPVGLAVAVADGQVALLYNELSFDLAWHRISMPDTKAGSIGYACNHP
jgi:hypothetical protein